MKLVGGRAIRVREHPVQHVVNIFFILILDSSFETHSDKDSTPFGEYDRDVTGCPR